MYDATLRVRFATASECHMRNIRRLVVRAPDTEPNAPMRLGDVLFEAGSRPLLANYLVERAPDTVSSFFVLETNPGPSTGTVECHLRSAPAGCTNVGEELARRAGAATPPPPPDLDKPESLPLGYAQGSIYPSPMPPN